MEPLCYIPETNIISQLYVKKNKSQREDIPMHTHKHAYTLVQSSKYMKAAVISYMAKKGF